MVVEMKFDHARDDLERLGLIAALTAAVGLLAAGGPEMAGFVAGADIINMAIGDLFAGADIINQSIGEMFAGADIINQ
jgi:hypothetical protein